MTFLTAHFVSFSNAHSKIGCKVECIVASIIVAKLDDVLSGSNNTIPILAVVLAIIASCNSVGAALYTESLFKVIYKNS